MLDPDRLPVPEILAALPIFPLPNVVFLPGMVLPLNVFEPRYLDLVDHVLDGGMHIGVPLLRPDPSLLEPDDLLLPLHDPGDGRPAIEAVFGVGQLIAHQRLPDGRRFIRLEGIGRVRVIEELPQEDRSFRIVSVEALPELEPANGHRLEVLKAQVERMAETFDEDDRQMIHTVLELDDPRITVYAIASLVPSVEVMRAVRRGRPIGGAMPHLRLQQRCLAAEDADNRIELLSERAQSLIDVLGESGSFPVSSLN
jgi:Lon protease-like protein